MEVITTIEVKTWGTGTFPKKSMGYLLTCGSPVYPVDCYCGLITAHICRKSSVRLNKTWLGQYLSKKDPSIVNRTQLN